MQFANSRRGRYEDTPEIQFTSSLRRPMNSNGSMTPAGTGDIHIHGDITINPLPGQDGKALAQEMFRELWPMIQRE